MSNPIVFKSLSIYFIFFAVISLLMSDKTKDFLISILKTKVLFLVEKLNSTSHTMHSL